MKRAYNFETPLRGELLHFAGKMQALINNEDDERIKDYICDAFDTWNPKLAILHPCHGMLRRGIAYLMASGWKFSIARWGNLGVQAVLQDKNGNYYHSNYDHANGPGITNPAIANLFENDGEIIKPIIRQN